MNIGWLRIGQSIEIDYMKSSVKALNTGERLGIWEALVKMGHKVVLLSHVRDKHKHMLEKDPVAEVYDYSWVYGNVLYNVHFDPDLLDFVILEYGPGTTLFSHKPNDNVLEDFVGKEAFSFYWYLRYLLEGYQGGRLVFMSGNGNSSMMMRVPLLKGQYTSNDFIVRYDPSLSESNLRYIMDGVDLSQYDWELWSLVLDAGRQQELLMKCKSPFGKLLSAYYGTELGYSDTFDPILDVRPVEHTEYDLMYIGHQRDKNRSEKLAKFLEPVARAGYSVVVYGDWNISIPGVDFRGCTSEEGSTPDYFNKAIATVYVAEKQFEYIGTMPARVVVAPRSGCAMFADADIHMVGEMVGHAAVLRDGEELLEHLERLAYNDNHRLEFIEHQRSLLVPWTDVLDGIVDGQPDVVASPLWEG